MKKLVIITNMFPWGKGERSFISPELEYLKEQFEVTILSRSPMSLRKETEEPAKLPDSVALMHYPEPELGKKEKIKYLWKAFSAKTLHGEIKEVLAEKRGLQCIKETYFFWIRALMFREWMRKNQLFEDIENTIFYSYWANYSVYSLAMEKEANPSLKFVTRMHGYDLYNERFPGGRQPFKRYVDERIDKIIFIAKVGYEYYMEHFADKAGKEDEKYVLCRMGVKNPRKYPEKKKGAPFSLVSCSTVSELKRVDIILEALQHINGNVEWHHFGDGPQLERIKNRQKEILLQKDNVKCVFHGHIENDELMNFYNENYVDCFITTSSSEGCPVSIQEALSYGIPVIGTDVGEIKYMTDGNGALLPTNPKPEDVAEAIWNMMESEDSEAVKRRERAKNTFQREYRLEQNTLAFIDVLKNL